MRLSKIKKGSEFLKKNRLFTIEPIEQMKRLGGSARQEKVIARAATNLIHCIGIQTSNSSKIS